VALHMTLDGVLDCGSQCLTTDDVESAVYHVQMVATVDYENKFQGSTAGSLLLTPL
jgi:hypothetical protein